MENIDIIMPVYNCEKYLEQAIKSVKEQTYQNWRLIIINDSSTDNSLKIITNSIKHINEKVKIIETKKNIGVAEARNIGLNKSSARYIAYLDSDDIWIKEKLEKQINFMKENNYSFSYTNFMYKKDLKNKRVKFFPRKLDYKKALKNTFILTSTVMIDTEYINKELLKMPKIESEDTATWWKILRKGHIAYGINENLVIYRVHKNGLSANKIKNIKKTWNLYRKQEKVNLVKSSYYFINYAINATLKRII